MTRSASIVTGCCTGERSTATVWRVASAAELTQRITAEESVRQHHGHILCTLAVNGGGGWKCCGRGVGEGNSDNLRGGRKRMRSSRSQLVCLTVCSPAIVGVTSSFFESSPTRTHRWPGECASPRSVRCRLLTKPRTTERTRVRDVGCEKAYAVEVKE